MIQINDFLEDTKSNEKNIFKFHDKIGKKD